MNHICPTIAPCKAAVGDAMMGPYVASPLPFIVRAIWPRPMGLLNCLEKHLYGVNGVARITKSNGNVSFDTSERCTWVFHARGGSTRSLPPGVTSLVRRPRDSLFIFVLVCLYFYISVLEDTANYSLFILGNRAALHPGCA